MKFIGVSHTAFDEFYGRERIENILRAARPGAITFEADSSQTISEISESIKESRRIAKRNILESTLKRKFVDTANELVDNWRYDEEATIAYATRTGTPLRAVDIPGPSRAAFGRAFADLVLSMFALYEFLDAAAWKELYTKQMHETLAKPPQLIDETYERCAQRDRRMARKISTFDPDLHVGGNAHLHRVHGRYASLIELLPQPSERINILYAFNYRPGIPAFQYNRKSENICFAGSQ